ncbi:MAG: peptidylprolyl isomerase [Bacteroidetes bacterium]|nr:peptidylprolyl isomerase [Bacteroidota bacterium]
MKKIFTASAIFCFLISCSSPKYKNPHVLIKTNYGNIEMELYPEQAPKSVAAFLSYVDAGYYKNSSFYRALNDENQPSGSGGIALLQGGTWKTKPELHHLPGIPHESTKKTKILHKNGTVSLSRQAPGSASTEFFICIGDQPGFDFGGNNNPDGQGYAAFGRVVKGMDIVKEIHNQPVNGESLVTPVVIKNIERL